MSDRQSEEPGQAQRKTARVLADAVAAAFAESPTLELAISRTLQAICESMRWEYGAFWRFDRQASVLRCAQVWHVPSSRIAEFETFSRQITLSPGVGFPGYIWARGQPAWVSDMTQASFSRSAVAAKVGLRGALGFPLRFTDEGLGVMELFSRETIAPDEGLLELLRDVARQIGELIQRKQPEGQ